MCTCITNADFQSIQGITLFHPKLGMFLAMSVNFFHIYFVVLKDICSCTRVSNIANQLAD